MADIKNKPESPVTEEEAKKHALFSVRSNWVMGFRGFEDLTQVGLGDTPIIIHDLNGQILFYEYPVLEADKEVGLVQASASRQIGSAAPQIQTTPRRWNPDTAKNKTREMMKKRYPKAKIIETDLVCYSYPKIGVRYLVDDPMGEGSVNTYLPTNPDHFSPSECICVRYVTLAGRVTAALALVRRRVAAPYSILAAAGAVARKPDG